MMRFFTRLLALSLVLCTLLSLVSCHGTRGEANVPQFDVPEGLDPDKSYEITFWAKSDSNATQTNLYRKAISDFEALYPNIKVKLVTYFDYGRIYQDVITNIPTGTTPNVCISYPDHVATYLEGDDIIVPLDTLMADERFGLGGSEVKFDGVTGGEIIEKFLNECKIGGVQYALPFMRSTEACYINKTYVERLGFEIPETLTWDFIWQVCEKALEKNADGTYKINGQQVMIPFIYKSTDNMMIQMLAQKGAPYSNDEGEVLIFNDECEKILLDINREAEKKTFSTFKISSYPGNYLNRGQCIFAIDSTAGATWMGADAPLIDVPESELVEFETVVKEIPQFDTENPKMISQGPSVCVFNKEDKGEVLASWLFCQFLLTNSVQVPYSETEGYVPVTKKAQSSPEYIDYLSRSGENNELYYSVKIDAAKLLLENTENTFITPVFNGSASLRNAAGQMIEEVTKAANRNKTVDEKYLDELYTKMKKLYKLDEISSGGGKEALGELPTVSVVLISVLVLTNAAMIALAIFGKVKSAKKQRGY